MGLAGVMPYLATSLSTVWLSFDIQYAASHGTGILMSGEVAEQVLHIIEPLQLGYGATVSILLTPMCRPTNARSRSSPSLVLFIGASNGPAMAANRATHAT